MWKDINYWIPGTKYELVSWLSHHFGTTQKKFKGMSKKKLYAIYFQVRNGASKMMADKITGGGQ